MTEEIKEYLAALNGAIREVGGDYDPSAQLMVKERKRLLDLLVATEPPPTLTITAEQWALIQRSLANR